MTDRLEDDQVVDVEALEPIKSSALQQGPAVDGVTALAALSDAEFDDKLQALVRGRDRIKLIKKKHRYRRGERACPDCGTRGSIIRGKSEFGGGFVCWKRKDGCGAKFPITDQRITGQQVGDVENPNQDDLENTVIKMSEKRAYNGATLRGTASSDLFTQDRGPGDGPGDDGGEPGGEPPPQQAKDQGPVQQPRANGQAAGDRDQAPGGDIGIAELHEARKLFPADVSNKITTSQQGRLYNLAGKNGWSNTGVDETIAQKLSMPTVDLPAIGDAYEAVVRWFQENQPEASA